MNKRRKYIVATTKEWNIKMFYERISKIPGSWKLISQPNELRLRTIKAFDPRYIFFIHWSDRVPKQIIDDFECICFHMTKLPFGRGGSPLQNLIARGNKSTMISAIRMVEEIDAGPIYFRQHLSLLGNAEEIFIRAGETIAEMIYILTIKDFKPILQQGEITKFKRRSPSESRIPMDANLQKAFDWIRMLDAEEYPPAFIEMGNLRIEFKRATLRYNRIEADAQITITNKEKADG